MNVELRFIIVPSRFLERLSTELQNPSPPLPPPPIRSSTTTTIEPAEQQQQQPTAVDETSKPPSQQETSEDEEVGFAWARIGACFLAEAEQMKV